MKQRFLGILLSACMLAATADLHAQVPIAVYSDMSIYRNALELFDKEKYAAALEAFDEYVAAVNDKEAELSIASEYYSGLSSLYLFHKDAEFKLERFIINHPESPFVEKIYFELATYNYKRKRYKKALEWFDFVDPLDLTPDDYIEFLFKRGDSYFKEDEVAKARQDFFEVKKQNSEYKTPAQYYYGHIAYEEGDYQTALENLEPLERSNSFAPIIPYYKTQIFYKQNRYDKVIEYTTPMLDSTRIAETKRVPEMARLLADAHYRNDDFESALPYFERYREETEKRDIPREDFYKIGFTYYRVGQYEEALDALAPISREEDELGQSALYQMAECYLKLDQKTYARTAFKEASSYDYNLKIKEDALFNYAKLAFELSYNPFNEAITAFEQYLEDYPESPRRDEAYAFLLDVYLKTRNYEEALRSLDRIQNKDMPTKEAYQLVAFNRGVELFQSKNYDAATEYFDKVSLYPINAALNADAIYWQGEVAFIKEKYIKAVQLYQAFLIENGAFSSENFNDARYNIGYAHFKRKKYVDALSAFRTYIDSYKGEDDRKLNDAFLRAGDCFYVNKNYDQAISNYDKALQMNGQPNRDYAYFQKARCYGLNDQPEKEAQVLKSLLETQANSKYTVDAKFLLGRSMLSQDELGNAENYYLDILENHTSSPYVKQSLVDLCLIYKKQGENSKVLAMWDRIVRDYPNDAAMKEAYPIVESVIIAERGPDALENLQDFTVLDISNEEVDTKTFNDAAEFYFDENCDAAIPKLSQYLSRFSPGIHAVEANYYLAECHFKLGDKEKALESYSYIITQPANDYSELALLPAATIQFNNKNYEQALNYYILLESVAVVKTNVLEAEIGQLRCNYKLGNMQYVEDYATKVIANENTPENIRNEAHLIRGRVRLQDKNWDAAQMDFQKLSTKVNREGAEANYNLCLIDYQKGNFKKAEGSIFDFVQKYSSYSEWKFKAFLLLSDVYVGLEDYFQARVTLNTVLENVQEEWVREEARTKLEELDLLENPPVEEPKSGDVEIDLNPNTNDKDLFDDEDED